MSPLEFSQRAHEQQMAVLHALYEKWREEVELRALEEQWAMPAVEERRGD